MNTSTNIAYDTKGFCRWLKSAKEGQTCVYHAGNLSLDRSLDPFLNELADTVMLVQETGGIITKQWRQYLPITDLWCYVAIRTRNGFVPKSIQSQKITALDYRAMRAIRDRDADISASRAIRDAISASWSSSDTFAKQILTALKDQGFLEEAPGKGWQLSAAGLRMMT